MSDGPSLSDFMRHLQAILEESEEIPDREDRETRQFQIESAIQEAILFGNRYKELVDHGIDPFQFVRSMTNEEHTQPVSKAESLSLGHDHCSGCGKRLENDLDFCASCGEKR